MQFAQTPSAGRPPRQLPAAVPSFVGRQAELGMLNGLAAEAVAAAGVGGTVAIAAIDGMAGVGKTTLAVHFAHHAAALFPDGQLHVDLRGFEPSGIPVDPAHAISGFLNGLGVPSRAVPRDADARAALYRSLLAGKKVLILIDNARNAAQVRPLLPGTPGCLVLVTSRHQLTGLAAVEGARLLTLGVLSEAEASELLAAHLGAAQVAAEPDVAADLARLCARLPLALTITAARGAVHPARSLAALAAELRATRLDALDADEPASDVRAAFTWSYGNLSEPAARMLRLLCLLHPGPDLSLAAAASLAGIPAAEGRRALRELAAASMLTERVSGRYACHDLLREYAAEQARSASDPGEQDAATQRLLRYFQHTVASLLGPAAAAVPDPEITPESFNDAAQALAWFEAMYRMMLAALTRAADARFRIPAWKISWPMMDCLRRYSQWRDPAAVRHATRETHPDGNEGKAAVRCHAAVTCAAFGDYDTARNGLEDCLGLYQLLGDKAGEGRVRQRLAWVSACQERYADAVAHAEAALALMRAADDRIGQVAVLNFVGRCRIKTGEHRLAAATCRRCLTLCGELPLRHLRHDVAQALECLGDAASNLEHHAAASECYESALAVFREYGDRFGEAGVLTRLAGNHRAAGQPRTARATLGQALIILDSLGHPDAELVRDMLSAIREQRHDPGRVSHG